MTKDRHDVFTLVVMTEDRHDMFTLTVGMTETLTPTVESEDRVGRGNLFCSKTVL